MAEYDPKKTYWLSEVRDLDDLGNPIHDEFIDGALKIRSHMMWGIFTPETFASLDGQLGIGRGQRYKKQPDGKWLKIEG